MKTTPSQRGLSLVELMVAIAIGILLMLGLVQVFGGLRAAFATSEGVSRVQENSRFALEFLRRDLRMAGHMGCLNEAGHPFDTDTADPNRVGKFFHHFIAASAIVSGIGNSSDLYPLRADRAVEVYDYTGTIPDSSYTLPGSGNANNSWTPALPVGLALNGIAVPGSDVVVVRYFDDEMLPLNTPGVTGSGGNFNLALEPGFAAQVQQWAPYGLTNCATASLLQVTSISGNSVGISNSGLNARNFDAKEGPYARGAMMYRYRVSVYYVGQGLNGPALYRKRLNETPGNADAGIAFGTTPEELVEGVEMMQVMLAVDTLGNDDLIDGYRSPQQHITGNAAAQTAALARIKGLRVSLLLRSQGAGVAAGGIAGPGTYVVGDVIVRPPNDQRLRQVYESQITIRNRVRI